MQPKGIIVSIRSGGELLLMKLIIFRDGEEIKHPITGKVLHTETEIVAEAKIDGVFDDVSRAVLLKSEAASEVKQLDRVITK